MILEKVVELEIRRGVKFFFHRSKDFFPTYHRELNLVEAKNIKGIDDLNHYLTSSVEGVPTLVPVIWNNGGSWLRLAGIAIEAGLEEVHVYQQENRNELLSHSRVVMKPDEASICFIPNYKCGYSSMWRFLRSNFESCSAKGRHTFSLNTVEFLKSDSYDFVFSFIRDPVKRLQSFYIDKFCREQGHHNIKDYLHVYRGILGDFDPVALIEFIGSIPSDFADRHWKSTWDNLHYDECPIFDVVYDINSESKFLSHISDFIRGDVEMPVANNTEKYEVSDIREFFSSGQALSLVNKYFYKDVLLYNAVSSKGFLRV